MGIEESKKNHPAGKGWITPDNLRDLDEVLDLIEEETKAILDSDFEFNVYQLADSNVELLLRKHKDYGPKNIAEAPGGALNGLRVRMHDKLARINHLLDTGAEAQNESLEDSFLDLANYALIAQLVIRGEWPSK